MKDLEQLYNCEAKVIASKIQRLNDPGHMKGGNILSSVYILGSFIEKVRKELDAKELGYIAELINTVSKHYPNISSIRGAISKNEIEKSVGNSDNDPSITYDAQILSKIYFVQSLT